MATLGYNAGLDSSDVVLRYQFETDWGETPGTPNTTNLRIRSEGFAGSKSRSRPDEIRAAGDAAQAITQSVEASGSISGLVSYGTFDDMLAGLLNNDWVDSVTKTAGADSITNFQVDASENEIAMGGGGGNSGTNRFRNFQVGSFIVTSGFTNGGNNGTFKIIEIKDNSRTLVVEGYRTSAAMVDETDTNASIKMLKYLRNGSVEKSWFIEKELASALYLRYPGSYITGGGIATNQGSFAECNFDFLCKEETKATAKLDASPTAAPSGRVFDTVTGLSRFNMTGVTTQPILQSISWSIAKEGARQQFGIGNVGALGMGRGTITGSGSLTTYFKDFSIYDNFVNETSSELSYRIADNAGNGYIIIMPNATITNPSITAGGPDTDMVADFELELNAATSGALNGVTMQIVQDPA